MFTGVGVGLLCCVAWYRFSSLPLWELSGYKYKPGRAAAMATPVNAKAERLTHLRKSEVTLLEFTNSRMGGSL
jgi:hypothetical protein